MITIGILLVGLVAGYLYYSQALRSSSGPMFIAPSSDTLSKFNGLGLNFGVLDDPKFKSLKIFGESPVTPGPTGRTDIFAQ